MFLHVEVKHRKTEVRIGRGEGAGGGGGERELRNFTDSYPRGCNVWGGGGVRERRGDGVCSQKIFCEYEISPVPLFRWRWSLSLMTLLPAESSCLDCCLGALATGAQGGCIHCLSKNVHGTIFALLISVSCTHPVFEQSFTHQIISFTQNLYIRVYVGGAYV